MALPMPPDAPADMCGSSVRSLKVTITPSLPPSLAWAAAVGAGAAPAARVGEATAPAVAAGAGVGVSVVLVHPASPIPARPSAAPRKTRRRGKRPEVQ